MSEPAYAWPGAGLYIRSHHYPVRMCKRLHEVFSVIGYGRTDNQQKLLQTA